MPVYKSDKPTKDGRSWFFSTYYIDLDGVRKKKKSKKFLLKKDAQEAEMVFLLTYTEQNNNNITFKELIIDYKNFQKDKVKINTYRKYTPYFEKIKSLNNIKLKDFNITIYNLWKKEINKLNITTIYKNTLYKYLRALLNYAIKYHNFVSLTPTLNKMTGFSDPSELKKEMSFWSYDEFKQFIKEEKDLKYICFFKTLYFCGLRRGEANALNWTDINLTDGIITINKSVSLKIKGNDYVINTPKTQSSNRILPLPKELLNNLKELKKEYKKYKNFSNNWFVFGGILPLADTTTDERKNKHIKNANLKYIRMHDFRHSCASLLISNGASISLVAKYLGHSNVTTTLNTYTHMFKNELDDIINIINDLN